MTVVSTDQQDIVSEHWDKQFEEMRSDSYYWINNRIIADHIANLMTGTSSHWLSWLFHGYFHDVKNFRAALSICCGDGAHEIEIHNTKKVSFIRGFDISEGAVQQAVRRFQEAGVPEDAYHFDVRDANRLDVEGRFDFILSAGALHHIDNLEDAVENIRRLLDPHGYFVLVEFVGPNRFQWTDQQVAIINQLLDALDPLYRKDKTTIRFGRPAVEDMIRMDPSEAVRAEDICRLVKQHFHVEYERKWNGTIIHQLYPLLNCRLANADRKDFDSILRLILTFEDILIRSGTLPSDFVFMVCRPKMGKE
jgi:SAM-dependent methyltransferase